MKPRLDEVKVGEMYCAVEGCGRVDKTHTAYCIKHGRSPHRIKEKNDKEKKEQVGKFKYKCICLWSKDDEYGFIPNTKCPVHGKQAKKLIKDTVDYEDIK